MIKTMYSNIDFEEYLKTYNQVYNSSKLLFFDDVIPLLNHLKNKKIKLAILSAKQTSFLKKHLEDNNLDNYFDYIH